MPRPRKYPQELIDRGVRLAIESGRPIAHVAADIGLPPETLRKRVRQAQADQGLGPDLPTSEEREEIKQLKRENYELRRANEIWKAPSVYCAIELDAARRRGALSSMIIVIAWGSSRSVRNWACRRPR